MEKIKEIWKNKPIWLRIILLIIISKVLCDFIDNVSIDLAYLVFASQLESSVFYIGNLAVSTGYFVSLTMWPILFIILLIIKPLRPIIKSFGRKCKGNNWKMFLLGSALGLGFNSIVVGSAILHGDIKLVFNNFNLLYCLILLFAVFIQAGIEELMYRGLILQATAKYFPYPVLIIGFNSFMFGYGHVFNEGATIPGILCTFVLAVLFSVFVYYMDSIWAAFGFHILWNFSQNILYGLPNSGHSAPYTFFSLDLNTAKDSAFYSVEFGPEGAILSSILGIIAIVIIVVWGQKKNKKMTNIWE